MKNLITLILMAAVAGCGGGSGGGGGVTGTWTDVSPGGTPGTDFPVGRQQYAMAYDSNSNVVVLFGGIASVKQSDTWEWDGATWADVSPAGTAGVDFPTARTGHAMAFDSNRNVVVLFGGDDAVGLQYDTWEWNGSTWSNESPSGTPGTDFPTARADMAMAFDDVRDVTVLFGGDTGTAESDTWEWNGTTWTDVSPSGTEGTDFPGARSYHDMVYDSTADAVVLFGGYVSTLYADTWKWNGISWTNVSPAGTAGIDFPSARRRHAMAYDSTNNRTVLFGGDNGAVRLSDTWEWNGSLWSKVNIAGTAGIDFPSIRNFHRMAYDSTNGVVMLFGGYGGGAAALDDTWQYDGN